MKRNIEKYFLFLFFFVFTLSIVNISPLFAKKEKEADPKATNQPLDLEACKKDVKADKTKPEEKYLALCKTQCTSTDPKYAKFKTDNKIICDLFPASTGTGGTSGTGGDGGTGGTGGTDGTNAVKNPEAIAKEKQIENLVNDVVTKLKTLPAADLDPIIPDFTTLASRYEFTLTFSDKLRDALQAIIFAKPAPIPVVATTALYNVLEDTTITAEDTAEIKERAIGAIKAIILKSFDYAPTDTTSYNDIVIKQLRDDWLNLDLKGDDTSKTTDFTVAGFKATTAGDTGYSLPHELYQSGFDDTLTKAIDDNAAADAAAKTAFVEAYKKYVLNNINILIKSDTWEEGKSLDFTVSLNTDAAKITLPAIDTEITTTIPTDLSTAEAYNKVKTVFTVTAKRIPYSDLDVKISGVPFADDSEVITAIEHTGLLPVRVTITPVVAAPDAAKPVALTTLYNNRLKNLKKVFNQRIIALATASTTLGEGADASKAPARDSLYEAIYNGASSGLTLTNVKKVNTITGATTAEITSGPSLVGDIVNAKVIAVRKGAAEDATDINILLQLDGTAVSPFEKLSGVTVSHAHIKDPAATAANFILQTNFENTVFSGTTATTDCPIIGTQKFFDRLLINTNGGCRNLLKITVSETATDLFGIRDGSIAGSTTAEHITAATTRGGETAPTITFILKTLEEIQKFTYYFNPTLLAGGLDSLYATASIIDQLKGSNNVLGFPGLILTHNWPALADVRAALATLPTVAGDAHGIVSLLRVSADPRSVYLTKKIVHS